MGNEDLIYRITRAVYGRLGSGADEETVEQLVADVYRAVESAVVSPEPQEHAATQKDDGSAQRMIVSVFGVDRPGIVAAVAHVLAESNCSIIDINQTVVRGKFAMVLIASTERSNESISALKDRFKEAGERLGVKIYAQREDMFHAMHRV